MNKATRKYAMDVIEATFKKWEARGFTEVRIVANDESIILLPQEIPSVESKDKGAAV